MGTPADIIAHARDIATQEIIGIGSVQKPPELDIVGDYTQVIAKSQEILSENIMSLSDLVFKETSNVIANTQSGFERLTSSVTGNFKNLFSSVGNTFGNILSKIGLVSVMALVGQYRALQPEDGRVLYRYW